MFNVGGPEVLVILLVALIVLGPQQLPKAVRSVGNVMAELRRMSSGFQDEIRNAMDAPIEADAREQGAQLARTPEDADITETVARNDDRPASSRRRRRTRHQRPHPAPRPGSIRTPAARPPGSVPRSSRTRVTVRRGDPATASAPYKLP